MNQSQEMSSEEKEGLSEAVNESLGVSEGENQESSSESSKESEHNELPDYAKKRLGMQEKRYKKELRKMQNQIDDMRSQLGSRPEPQHSPEQPMNNYSSQSNPPGEGGNFNHEIYSAVAKALQAKEEQENKAKQSEMMQHVHKKYKEFGDHLDNYSDKHEDFDDVVKSDDAPYTGTMRDMAMILHGIPGIDSAETLYHIGKDRDKLSQLSKLHPVDQAKEVVKIAIALMNGNGKQSSSSSHRPLGQVKSNPIKSTNVNESTSVDDIRKRMKSGGKRWA